MHIASMSPALWGTARGLGIAGVVATSGTRDREGEMNRFQLREIRIENYRCFDELRLSLEEDTTVLFAENGGGKTALLKALAMGPRRVPEGCAEGPEARREARSQDAHARRAGAARAGRPVQGRMDRGRRGIGIRHVVDGGPILRPDRKVNEHQPIFEALERVRVPGDRWPLFAWYGVDRLGRLRGGRRKVERTRDRWEAYTSALDPNLDEAPLLQWLQDEMLGDGGPQAAGRAGALVPCSRDGGNGPGDARRHARLVRPGGGRPRGALRGRARSPRGPSCPTAITCSSRWSADIARRAVMLNEVDGADAPKRVEGVVLIGRDRPPPAPALAARGASAPA